MLCTFELDLCPFFNRWRPYPPIPTSNPTTAGSASIDAKEKQMGKEKKSKGIKGVDALIGDEERNRKQKGTGNGTPI